MQGIRELEATLGLTTDQVRARVGHLRDSFDNVVIQGQRGKLLVNDNGVVLLQKLQDLLSTGLSLEAATKVIKDEIENGEQHPLKVSPTVPEPDPILIQTMQDTIGLLKDQLAIKDNEIDRLHDLLNRQLPPESEGRKKVGRLAALKATLTGRI